MPKEYYSTGDAAQLLGVSNDTIRRWDRAGRIKVERDGRNQRMISTHEIDRLRGDLNKPISTARNRLSCTVTDVALDGLIAQIEMIVTGPTRITAVITRDAAEELGLSQGDSVTAIVNPSEVMIVS